MNIDRVTLPARAQASLSATEQVVPLERRMAVPAGKEPPATAPEFERFYQQFCQWLAQRIDSQQLEAGAPGVSAGEIQRYLKDQLGADGQPLYRTSKQQMAALTEVMTRLKQEGGSEQPSYKTLNRAVVSVSAASGFVQSFMAEVFKPNDNEDSWENIVW